MPIATGKNGVVYTALLRTEPADTGFRSQVWNVRPQAVTLGAVDIPREFPTFSRASRKAAEREALAHFRAWAESQ